MGVPVGPEDEGILANAANACRHVELAIDPIARLCSKPSEVKRRRLRRPPRARDGLLFGAAQVVLAVPQERGPAAYRKRSLALANEPPLIFADEPAASLDTGRGMKVMDLLKRVARERNSAIIAVTHDVPMIAGFDTIYRSEADPWRRTMRARSPLTWQRRARKNRLELG